MRTRRAASAASEATGMRAHTPGLHRHVTGCTGMRMHTPGLHPYATATGRAGARLASTRAASAHNANERDLFLMQNNEK